MDAKEIFELIIKADEKLKYATAGKQDMRRTPGARPVDAGAHSAVEIGNDALVQQADTRLTDLDQN